MVSLVCAHCGVSFSHPRHSVFYCSRECRYAAQAEKTGPASPRFGKRRGETRSCVVCGTTFYVYPSQLKSPLRTNLYCSHKCKGVRVSEIHTGKVVSEAQKLKQSAKMKGRPRPDRIKPPIELKCRRCGETFYLPGRYTFRASVAKFCGTACWYDHLREHPEDGGCYKGGYQPYYGPNWREQARLARERDGHRCFDCGKHQKRPLLDVHHLHPFRLYQGDYVSGNALDNIVTLCKSCHPKRRDLAV